MAATKGIPPILIDGDVVVYRCGFAAEKTRYDFYLDSDIETMINPETGEPSYDIPDGVTPVSSHDNAKDAKAWLEQADYPEGTLIRVPRKELDPIEHCLHSVKVVMDSVANKFADGDRSKLRVYFSCSTKDNWRTQIYPEYKANRPERRPFWGPDVREYLESHWKVETLDEYEADDLISMDAWHWLDVDPENPPIIVSIDKDFRQIPCLHYNWPTEELDLVSDDEALQNLWAQRISGDATDNIKGVPKFGDKTARAWLAQPHPGMSVDDIILAAYSTAYKDKEEATYHMMLTSALVTLPQDAIHRQHMELEVLDARKKV